MVNINYRDSRPIYEQVRDGLRALIVSGAIEPERRLPSVRELAGQLAINPNTIQRALRELEAEGYIYSVPGKGSFACSRQDVDDERKRGLLKQFDEAARELLYLGLRPEELRERISGGDGI